MDKTNPDLLCRELIGRHLARRKKAFEQFQSGHGSYGFSSEAMERFTEPFKRKRQRLKERLQSLGLKGKEFEKIWHEVAKRQP